MCELAPWLLNPFHEFVSAFAQRRLPGSLILSCANGLGSEFLAANMAKHYLCHAPTDQGPCGHCRACLALENGEHPDFIRVPATLADEVKPQDGKQSNGLLRTLVDDASKGHSAVQRYVRIASLRAMQERISESAAMGHGKVAIISDAQFMPPSAANAVLKTFEEPPENTLIIMVTTSLDALLPTILSRAYKLRVAGPSFSEAKDFLEKKLPTTAKEQLELALCLSYNAPYGAVRLLNSAFKVGKSERQLMDVLVNALRTLAAFFEDRTSLDKLIDALKVLPSKLCSRLLEEIIFEALKYKAGVKRERLPLMSFLPYDRLAFLQAANLFAARRDLKFIATAAPMPPSRAPAAQLRTWFLKLTGRL